MNKNDSRGNSYSTYGTFAFRVLNTIFQNSVAIRIQKCTNFGCYDMVCCCTKVEDDSFLRIWQKQHGSNMINICFGKRKK